MSQEFTSANFNWDELGINPEEAVGPTAEYQPQLSFPPAPDIAKAIVTGVDGTLVWGRDTNGNLYFRGQFQIQGGKDDGKKVSAFVSSRPLPFRPDSSSEMDDFIFGAVGALVKTKQEIVDTVNQTFLSPHKVQIDREGYCRDCGKTVAKGKNGSKKENKDGFKLAGFLQDGEVKQVIACPICGAKVAGKGIISRWYAD